jgi:hypothetical protein
LVSGKEWDAKDSTAYCIVCGDFPGSAIEGKICSGEKRCHQMPSGLKRDKYNISKEFEPDHPVTQRPDSEEYVYNQSNALLVLRFHKRKAVVDAHLFV